MERKRALVWGGKEGRGETLRKRGVAFRGPDLQLHHKRGEKVYLTRIRRSKLRKEKGETDARLFDTKARRREEDLLGG